VTFLLGWQDGDGVFLCADSAVTRVGVPSGSTSSFGEAQQVDRFAVEERAVKLLELPRGILVAVCGDADSALDFVMSLRSQLAYTNHALPDLLDKLATSVDPRHGFELLIAHRVGEEPVLTAFVSDDRSIEAVGPERFATFGSMPDDKKDLAARLVSVVRAHPLPPEARLAASLVALQSVGITEYLPQHHVGGTFFGARLARDGVHWQADLCYLTYSPRTFRGSVFIEEGDNTTVVPPADGVEKVRVLVRDGAGILLSSLGQPRGRVLIPPTSDRTEAEWKQVVLVAVPPPFRMLVPSRHVGLLSTQYSKAVYIYNPDLRDSGAFHIGERHGEVTVSAVPELMQTFKLATPPGRFDLTIVTEDPDGTDAKTYGVAIPT
jgi:hypothetical protein